MWLSRPFAEWGTIPSPCLNLPVCLHPPSCSTLKQSTVTLQSKFYTTVFTNWEESLLSQILCQKVEWGKRKPVPDLVHFNDYADRCILLCFGKGSMDGSGRPTGKRENRLTPCSWDNLVRAAIALSTLVWTSNRPTAPWKPSLLSQSENKGS